MVKSIKRKYPSQPIVGVGAVVLKGKKVLLIKRGKNPSLGEWSIPGGAVNVGESLREAVLREINEETGLTINIDKPIEVLERIFRDKKNRVKYHYILIDYRGDYRGGRLKPSSDILDARFVSTEELDKFGIKEITKKVIERALESSRNKEVNISGETEIISSWNLKKARWYHKALKESDFSKKVVEAILPIIQGSKSLLDIGAGCGALTIPLAQEIDNVTALEPSKPMMNIMKKEALKIGLHNINFVNAHWGETKLAEHEVAILANVPWLLNDIKKFLKEIEEIKPRLIFLIQGVDPNKDKFYFKQLYPIIFGKTFPEKEDYLAVYSYLHRLGIYANIKIISYNLDQPFKDLNEALEFWKEYLNLKNKEHDEDIKNFLNKKLKKTSHGLIAQIPKKSAIIWWERRKNVIISYSH